jgi:hypothetical protein
MYNEDIDEFGVGTLEVSRSPMRFIGYGNVPVLETPIM